MPDEIGIYIVNSNFSSPMISPHPSIRRGFASLCIILAAAILAPFAQAAPSDPSNVVATVVNNHTISITWADNSASETGFNLEVQTGVGEFVALQTLGTNATNSVTWEWAAATPGTSYTFRVRAYEGEPVEYSGYATSNQVTTPSIPSVANLVATVVNNHTVSLTWDDNSSTEAGFNLEVQTGTGEFVALQTLGANGTSSVTWEWSAANPGTNYTFRVRTYEGEPVQYSDFTSSSQVSTPVVAGASNLVAAVVNSQTINLTWQDNSSTESNWVLEAKAGTGSFVEIDVAVPSNGTANGAYTWNEALPQTAYEFRIRAKEGTSYYSDYATTAAAVTTGALIAPTGLTGSVTNFHQIVLSWTDTAPGTHKTAIEVKVGTSTTYASLAEYTPVAGTAQTYTWADALPATSYVFRIRNKQGTAPYYSTYSAATASLTTPTLAAPTSVVASVVSPTSIKLKWKDNTTGETGFLIERKIQTGAWRQVGFMGAHSFPDASFTLTSTTPLKSVSFRVRAYYDNTAGQRKYSAYGTSNIVSQPTVMAPSGVKLSLSNAGNGIAVNWNDNSTDETGFTIEVSISGGAWQSLGNTGAGTGSSFGVTWTRPNSASHPRNGFTYRFRIKAFKTAGTAPYATTYSAYSTQSATISMPKTLPFAAPTNLVVTLDKETGFKFNWTDNSKTEDGTEFYYRVVGDPNWISLGQLSNPTATSVGPVTGFSPGTHYEFMIKQYKGSPASYTGASNLVQIWTLNQVTSRAYFRGFVGATFNHSFVTSNPVNRTAQTLTGQPAAFTFNSTAGTLSGSLTTPGVYPCTYSATFANGSTITQTFKIHIESPPAAPVVGVTIPAWNAAPGATRDTPLTDKFSDPDSNSAVRVVTSKGTMDFILYSNATPGTVANFLAYVNSARYKDVLFHRSVSNFVVQAGAFQYTGFGTDLFKMITDPAITNEPGITNIRGTIAMAKVDNDPNSATNQFFINTVNNAASLDTLNGGFTVFGRVAGNGMTVADAINALPRATYNFHIGSASDTTSLADYPMDTTGTAPTTYNGSMNVKIISATQLTNSLTYSVASNSNPAVVTATIVNGSLHLVAVSAGSATVTVRATDLDGNGVPQDVAVTISASRLAAERSIASAAATFDAPVEAPLIPSLPENTEPAEDDSSSTLSETSFLLESTPGVALGETNYATVSFTTLSTSGWTYEVESSESSDGPWSLVWTSEDGFDDPLVIGSSIDESGTTYIIRDTVPQTEPGDRQLRVRARKANQ